MVEKAREEVNKRMFEEGEKYTDTDGNKKYKYPNVCPYESRVKGITNPPRTCDYLNDSSEYYSECRDVMNGADVKAKMPYLYAAYNGGAGANCHNQTEFSTCSPGGFCPKHSEKKGVIWGCDNGNGYDQTRKGAKRLLNCLSQFEQSGAGNQGPSQLKDCCNSGQDSCITSCTP